MTAKTIPVCPKCGTIYTWYPIRSGTPSCCARDGSWFKNCGTDNDDDFDYTWFEGILACQTTSTTQPQFQGMLREKVVIVNQAYVSKQNQTNTVFDNDDVRDALNVNSNVLFELTSTVVYTSLLLIQVVA